MGKHVLADFYGCDVSFLQDSRMFMSAVLEAVDKSGVTILDHQFTSKGYSGVVLLEESHLAFYMWPEHDFISLDYYTCNNRTNPEAVVDELAKKVRARSVEKTVHLRGHSLTTNTVDQVNVL